MGSMNPALSTRVTETEFLSLPPSGDKRELVDQELVVTPRPSNAHQSIVHRLVMALGTWADGQAAPITVRQAPLDVRFGPGRILQPDVFVILAAIPYDHAGPIDRVPDLCIEVLSGNRAHERVTKRYIYAEAGVREYWIIDPAGIFERWHGPALAQGEELERTLSTPVLEGFTLDIAALLPHP